MTDEKNIKALLKRWPEAENIQQDYDCACGHGELMISFQLPQFQDRSVGDGRHGEPMEDCGFWCSVCNWSNAGARPKVFDPYKSRIENEQQELEALRTFYNIMTSEDAHTEVLDALIKDEENLAVWAELAVTCSELVMFYEEQRRAEESG